MKTLSTFAVLALSAVFAFGQANFQPRVAITNSIGGTGGGGGGFVPTDVSGLQWWYTDTSTNAGNGNAVSAWPDLSGNTQLARNAASTVVYKTGGPNGKALLEWAGGATDILTNSSTYDFEPGTFFILMSHYITNESKTFILDMPGTFNSFSMELTLDKPQLMPRSNGPEIGGAVTMGGIYGTNWFVFVSTYAADGTWATYDATGATVASGTRAIDLATPVGGFCFGTIADSRPNCQVIQVGMYDTVLSGGNIASLCAYLKAYGGL